MKREGTPWYKFISWLMRTGYLGLMGGVEVRGMENVPMSGPVIIAPVHVSYLDPPVLGGVCPRALRFMAKEELFKGLLGRLIRSLGAFPVKRGTSDTAAVRLAIDELNKGRALIMFAEGQRGDGVTMNPIQSGMGMLAKKTGAQVVPVGLGGTNVMWPRGYKKIRRARITVVFGKPFRYADIEASDEKEARRLFSERLGAEILQLTNEAGLPLKASETKPTPAMDDRHEPEA